MRQPHPPYVELGFYSDRHAEKDFFRVLFKALLDAGAAYTGIARVHMTESAAAQKYSSIADFELEEVSVKASAILQNRVPPNLRIVQALMHGFIPISSEALEILTFTGISEDAALRDLHPLAILAEGTPFSKPLEKSLPPEAVDYGGVIYSRFRELLRKVRPSYAAITMEYGLECPTDLAELGDSYALCDFYVSRGYVGSSLLLQIQRLLNGAHQEQIADGVYFSMTPAFNPSHTSFEADTCLDLSCEVGRILGSVKQI